MQKHYHPSTDHLRDEMSTEGKPESEASVMAKIMAMSRTDKRARLRIRHNANSRPFSRVRSGVRTGTTAHFRAWMAELGYKSILSGMKLDAMADQLDGRLASTFALLRVSGGIRNIYQLSQSSINDLLAVPQIGPARLAEVEKYLTGKNVPLKWTAA